MAAVKPITTQLGQSCPPQGPHTITFHVPGWDTAMRFRDGDKSIISQMRSIYPRFGPFGLVAQLAASIGRKLDCDPTTHGVLLYLDPAAFDAHIAYAQSPFRADQNRISHPNEVLAFRAVDVGRVRLFCVVYPLARAPAVIGVWQNAGIGVSSRLAEELLLEPIVVVDSNSPPTFLPEVPAHGLLRRRIRDLVRPEVAAEDEDVLLYGTGMAAIYRLHEALLQLRGRKATVLVLGAVFHNTFHLFEEAPGGMKHFGACDGASGVMERVEKYLEEHYSAGGTVAYAFIEFPSNPLLVSADLTRLRSIADKYSFPLVIDDTIGSFANINVLPVADAVITSLTKSFSGYANVMAGAITLNPLSRHQIKSTLHQRHFNRNELAPADADALLANSADYFARTTVLNANAYAIASLLHEAQHSASSPVTKVLYPPFSDTRANYDAFKRPASSDFTPGYGCLLSVDFESVKTAKAFYDDIQFHTGPHLGGHRTLAVPFSALVFGRSPQEAEYHAAYGAREAQLRISAGLEDTEELLAVVREALGRAERAYNGAVAEGTEADFEA